MLRAATVCTALYAPWFIFAWCYYGSPVPHTVFAKIPSLDLAGVENLAGMARRLPAMLTSLFLAPYEEHLDWHNLLPALLLGIGGTLYWIKPRGNRWARQASLAAFGGICYLAWMPKSYPWYFPAPYILALPAWAALAETISRSVSGASRRAGKMALAAGLAGIVGLALLSLDYAGRARITHRIVEWEHRREIGLWLKNNAAAHNRVYLECVGYIGYFSGLQMEDYPGLISPTVVRIREQVGDDMARVAMVLLPEWMVLRPEEHRHFDVVLPGWLQQHYMKRATFSARKRLAETLPAHRESHYDSEFILLRLREDMPGDHPAHRSEGNIESQLPQEP
jgi:hypothetical protein